MMREYKYDAYIDHKIDHERLLDEIRELMDDFEYLPEADFGNFGKELEAWFSGHFKSQDARLHRMLGDE